ncbi:MAG: DUF1549 domain-containing protein [Proteobacteria bacterium]|nr:DUF1549 domain-containing protein [Pseudomonadota bacterium]
MTDIGLATAGGRGEGLILARFDDFAVVGRLIVLPVDDAFVWSETPSFNYIDDFVHAKLRTLHMQSSEVCSDQVFVRRVFVDIVGLLPTAAEYERFVGDEFPDKRARLIDDLLERPEFPELWAMKWAELLRIESGSRRISHKAMYLYSEWIKSSILRGVPMDRMVRELLGAQGGNFRNPPANFYLVDTSPTQMAENVAQVFMGIRIKCAQCHNHPFERWTQDDYYSFAAFFAQVGTKTSDDPRESIVFNSGSGEVQHLSTGRVMPPKFLGGQIPAIPGGGDRRKVLSEWLTGPENPYFAPSFVDRVWAHFMGRGLVEPPDDVRVSNPPSHPALRARLARELIESNYDLRALVRTIANSRTYQLSTHTNPTNAGDRQNLSHAIVRRLPAETLLDAALRRRDKTTRSAEGNAGGGAVVVMDVHTGAVLAAASAPRFDPNIIARGDEKQIDRMFTDRRRPMFDRVAQMALPPGSVFKTLSAVALLETGTVEADRVFRCRGYLHEPDRFRCLLYRRRGVGHNDVSLTDALARSCNVYFFHFAGEMGAHVVVEAAQEQGPAIELRDPRAEAVEDTGELDRDIAAADDDHAFGQRIEEERLVRGDRVLGPGELGHHRPAAGGDEDVPGAMAVVADRDRMGVGEPRVVVDDRDAAVLEHPPVDAVEPRDLVVLVGDQPRPVEAALADRPAEALGVLEVVREVRGVDQELLGHAADVDAGAAEVALLGDRDTRAIARRDARRAHPARAAADDEEVVVVISHRPDLSYQLSTIGDSLARRRPAG